RYCASCGEARVVWVYVTEAWFMSTRLSDQHMAFYAAFGYLNFPGLLSDRIAAISEEFEVLFMHRGGGHNGRSHDGKARSCIVPFIDQSEYLSSLLDDPRI